MQLLRASKWFILAVLGLSNVVAKDFRPPAVPLIANSPYFSVWSMADRLTDDVPRHWTGTPQSMSGLVRIDGKPYRIMGNEPEGIAAMEQRKLQVLPTRTVYDFAAAGVGITLTFMTPVLPSDLDVMSRPVTYVTWTVQSKDGKEHAVALYFDASGQLAVDTNAQEVVASRLRFGGVTALRVGSELQPILQKAGDFIRIDWGYLYAFAPPGAGTDQVITTWREARKGFAETGSIPADDVETPEPAVAFPERDGPTLAYRFDLGKVGLTPVSRYVGLAYDERFAVQYLDRWLRPYWRRKGASIANLIEDSMRDYEPLTARCRQFDEELMADLGRVGGEDYALVAALAYRESFAAQGLAVDYDGTPLSFPKENSSCGCVSTVDVIYPAAPILLLFNTTLLKASMTPLLAFAGTYHWPFPFAPQYLGEYPHANGPAEVGDRPVETRMPVEESANMILMAAAIAKADGNADYAAKYWPLLSKWAQYLEEKGLDPEKQLVTDDFTGLLAHNANLSVKAISALSAYATLCEMLGKKAEAASYRNVAQQYAQQWQRMAADGDHYRLAFDQPGTWSQKYNLIWDKVLGLKLFPPEVARTEIAFYKTKQNAYGLPLDSRAQYTKLDWLLWTATLSDNAADFAALFSPVYKFTNETPDRVPLTDFYETDTGKHREFQARSVVGGVFIKMLADEATWKKWAGRAVTPEVK